MMKLAVLAALLCFQAEANKDAESVYGKVRLTVNPIRRVVTMLQSMQKKVADEGKKGRSSI
jgi:hypothetical protein